MSSSIQVVGRTIAYGNVERLVVFVSVGTLPPADDEWVAYLRWVKTVADEHGGVEVLVLAGPKAPSASQRALITREISSDKLRMAILLSDKRILPIAKVFGWFVKNTKVLGLQQVNEGLSYLGHPMSREVESLLVSLRAQQGGATAAAVPHVG